MAAELRITVALAWWNESPEDLTTCVKAAAQIADRIVAIDGSYVRYPGATVKSSDAEVRAIRRAARSAGMKCIIEQPDRLWLGQNEKRTELLRTAMRDTDWVLVLDADHVVFADGEAVRAELAAMPDWVTSVAVDFYTPKNGEAETADRAASWWHVTHAGQTSKAAVFFRPIDNVRVPKRHWIYVGKRNGRRVEYRYGGPGSANLEAKMVIEHRTFYRTEEQIRASRAYLNDRQRLFERTGQEDHREDVPLPAEWDMDTLAFRPKEVPPPDDAEWLARRRAEVQSWTWSVGNWRRPGI